MAVKRWKPKIKYRIRPGRPFWIFRWRDKRGKRVEESSGVAADLPESDAIREALEWERRLVGSAIDMRWEEACDLYDKHRMTSRSKGTRANWLTTKRAVEKFAAPYLLEEISTTTVDELVTKFRETEISPATIAGHLRYLRAFCKWCHVRKYLAELPVFEMPQGIAQRKSREVTSEEFAHILSAVDKNAPAWHRLLWGLWESGLRLSEIIALKWEDTSPVSIKQSGEFWGFQFHANGQKNKKAQWIPMTRGFHERFIAPAEVKTGYVFPVPNGKGEQMSVGRVCRAISDFGEKANVRTSDSKFATAHDLRRSFATRHAHLGQWQLAALMRHDSPATTQQFYLGDQAKGVAVALWGIAPPVCESCPFVKQQELLASQPSVR